MADDRTARLFFTTTPDVLEEVHLAASSEGRTMSNMLNRIVPGWAKQRRTELAATELAVRQQHNPP